MVVPTLEVPVFGKRKPSYTWTISQTVSGSVRHLG